MRKTRIGWNTSTATETVDTGMHQFVARVSAVTGQVGSVVLYGVGA